MSTESESHRWRSPLLGEVGEIALPLGRLEYFRRGRGPTVVFAHGWLANANLWRLVVDRLAERCCCIALDLPLGSHRVACAADADLTPPGIGATIAGALEALDLRDVTLVGNDSGGAYSQIATARLPDRIGRLVLNSCETPYDAFPPPPFDGLPALASDPEAVARLTAVLGDRTLRTAPQAYGLLMKRPIDEQVFDSYSFPCVRDAGVLRDVRKVIASASTERVHEAGQRLIAAYHRPVVLAWAPEDQVFPVDHARRYAAALERGRLALIDDAYSFTPEDQPARLAEIIAEVVPS